MKKLFLTSAIIAVMSYPAIALDANNHIQPSPTNDCVETTLGTATGPANLEADWTANTINLEWYNEDTKLTVPTTSNTCRYDGQITLPSTNPTKTGYTFRGWQVRQQTLDLMALIGVTEAGASYAWINNNGQFGEDKSSHGQSYYGINGNNTWAVDYGTNGMLIGQGRCSTTPGTANFNGANSTFSTETNIADETGQTGARYCYCGVTGYKDTNGNMQSLSSAWVFYYDFLGASLCASSCASGCSRNLGSVGSPDLAFRAAVLGVVQ